MGVDQFILVSISSFWDKESYLCRSGSLKINMRFLNLLSVHRGSHLCFMICLLSEVGGLSEIEISLLELVQKINPYIH